MHTVSSENIVTKKSVGISRKYKKKTMWRKTWDCRASGEEFRKIGACDWLQMLLIVHRQYHMITSFQTHLWHTTAWLYFATRNHKYMYVHEMYVDRKQRRFLEETLITQSQPQQHQQRTHELRVAAYSASALSQTKSHLYSTAKKKTTINCLAKSSRQKWCQSVLQWLCVNSWKNATQSSSLLESVCGEFRKTCACLLSYLHMRLT